MLFPRSLLALAPLAVLFPAVARGADLPNAPFTPAERAAVGQVLARACDPSVPERPEALDDTALTAVIVRYATTELGLRVRPTEIDRNWSYTPPPHDAAAELAAARAAGRLGDWLQGVSPPDPRYRALVAARCRYRAIYQAGGWPTLPKAIRLQPGDLGPQTLTLRKRLAAEGYLPQAAAAQAGYDVTLSRAVSAFQRTHRLTADGAVSGKTLAALNVPALDRLAQIEANLERWRWLPRPLALRRVEVDLAGAEAALYVAGQPTLSMRAIVGDPKHKSPLFSSRMSAVVLNPPWNVPASIANAELYPKAAKDPGYLARNNFIRTENGLQQRPGPKNSLGQLKFDFPSPFGVYLHDTPAKSLFGRDLRTLSHGCMRLEKPRELAEALLADQGWTDSRIEAVIAAGGTERVDLRGGPAIYVSYRTVVADADGGVEFRPDPYGWDAKLTTALTTRALSVASAPGRALGLGGGECAGAR